MADGSVGDPILIRFDGLDADEHEIELTALAESLRGLARVIGVSGNFAATQRYIQHKDAMLVRVVVKPPSAHCFDLIAVLKWTDQHQLASSIVGDLTVALITYIFTAAAHKREEMKEIRGALDLAIKELGNRDQGTVDRLLSTVDKMTDALIPAVRQAVTPIGNSASTLTISGPGSQKPLVVTEADKVAIMAGGETTVGDEQTYRVLITELDIETGVCKLRLEGGDPDERVAGKITDPAVALAQNAYALALAAKVALAVRAKPILADGQIDRLFISNVATA